MDPLGDPLTTRPIQTGGKFTIEPYPIWQWGFIYNLDRQFGNSLGWTRTRTRSDGPEPLLTLHPDSRPWLSTGRGTLDNPHCNSLDVQEVVRIELGNGKPLVPIPKQNAHLVHLDCTEQEQDQLMTLVERYTSQGASGAYMLAGMFLFGIGRHWRSEWHFRTIV